MLCRWPKLRELDLCGNPVCKIRKYRDHLTTICKCLGDCSFDLQFQVEGERLEMMPKDNVLAELCVCLSFLPFCFWQQY